MLTLIIYEVKVAVIMAVFYLCYKLLLSHDTLHQFNRLILVFTTILSFVLPFCVITVHKTIEIDPFENFMPALNTIQYVEAESPANVPYMDFDATKGDSIGEMPVSTAPRMPWWQIVLIMAYLAGAVAIITKVIVELIKVRLIIKRGERHFDTDGTEIIVVDADIAPFSWMRWIVMSRADYDSGNHHIINHEKAHIALGHSNYVLAIDVLSSMQWFNPVMWLLRADLRAIYEYEADDAVLRQGANIKEYQYSLIKKAVSASGYSITNSLNHSILKNRITMMSKSRTPMLQGLKALYIVPLVAAALATNAQTVVDYKTSEKEQPSNADNAKVVGNEPMGNAAVSTPEHSENIAAMLDGKRISYEDLQKSKSSDTTSNETFKDGESDTSATTDMEMNKSSIMEMLKNAVTSAEISFNDITTDPNYPLCENIFVITENAMDKDPDYTIFSPVWGVLTVEKFIDGTSLHNIFGYKYHHTNKYNKQDSRVKEFGKQVGNSEFTNFAKGCGSNMVAIVDGKYMTADELMANYKQDDVKWILYWDSYKDTRGVSLDKLFFVALNNTNETNGKKIDMQFLLDETNGKYDEYRTYTIKNEDDAKTADGKATIAENTADKPIINKNPETELPVVVVDGKVVPYTEFQKIKSSNIATIEEFQDGKSDAYAKFGIEPYKKLIVATLKKAESKSNTFEIDVINLTTFLPFIITPDPAENIVIVYDGKQISLKDFKKIKSNKIKSVTMAKDNESDVYAKYGVTPGNPLMVVTSKSENEEQDDFWNTATSVLTSSIVNFLTSSYYAREDISNVNVIALTPQNIEDYIIVADGKRIDYKDFQKIKSNGFSGVEIVKGKSRMPEYEKYGVKENSTLIMVTLKE